MVAGWPGSGARTRGTHAYTWPRPAPTTAAEARPEHPSAMFAAWMIGFLLVMALMVWLAVVIGLPEPVLGLAVLLLLGMVVLGLVAVNRRHRPPPDRRR